MMRRGDETPEEEKARFAESRRFAKAVKEILGQPPDIVFEHVGKATFPTSVFCVRPFGKVVICAGTTGYNLDFDVRHLWMRQKEIIGSHFANAYECMKANELIEQGKIRPVLWRTMGFDGVAEAHQLMLENKHLGKIAILVGATEEGQGGTPRARARSTQRSARSLWPASAHGPVVRDGPGGSRYARSAPGDVCSRGLLRRLALRYGATQYSVHRSRDDRYRIIQMAWFESPRDWYRYWEGPEMIEFRRQNSGHYQIPVTYVWHEELAFGALGPEVLIPPEPRPNPSRRPAELC